MDIVRLFGWDVLGKFWSELNKEHEVPAGGLLRLEYDDLNLRLSSKMVYDTLERYKTLPPKDNTEFREFAKQWWSRELKDANGWVQSENEHFEQLTAYNEQSAETVRKVTQGILDEYFPDGRPGDGDVSVDSMPAVSKPSESN